MRELKFRAWDDLEERFWTLQDGGEESGDGSVQYFGNEQGVLEIGRLEEFDVGLGISTQFTVFPLSQYTGLKDKNGREIYEGDLVDCNGGVGKVIMDIPTGQWSTEQELDNHSIKDPLWTWIKEHEVIGNIYEDTYLLEVKA